MKTFVALLSAMIALPLPAALASDSATPPPGRDFGAGLTLNRPTPLAEVLREPSRFEGHPILVHGRITDVCQKKGCWTVLRDGDEQVRVQFLDYGFFLPRDSTGADAWAEGVVTVETLSEAEARHYESESRDGDPSRIEGPQRRVILTAAGIRLVRPR